MLAYLHRLWGKADAPGYGEVLMVAHQRDSARGFYERINIITTNIKLFIGYLNDGDAYAAFAISSGTE